MGTLGQIWMVPWAQEGGVGESGPGDFRVPGWGIWRPFPSRTRYELLPGLPHGLTHLVPLACILLLLIPHAVLGNLQWHTVFAITFRRLE